MGTQQYVIRGGIAGGDRLRLLCDVMGPSTRNLLVMAGIPKGVAWKVGCRN